MISLLYKNHFLGVNAQLAFLLLFMFLLESRSFDRLAALFLRANFLLMNTSISRSILSTANAHATIDSVVDETLPPPLRIALLGYRSHPFVGGQGIYLTYLSRALTALGHHVDVYSGPPYPQLDDNVSLIKVPSLDLYAQPTLLGALSWKNLMSYSDIVEFLSKLTGGFAEPYTFGRRVKKYLYKDAYDIVHDNQSLSWGLLDLQNRGFSVVSTIHHPIHMDRKIALDATKARGHRWLVKRWYRFLNMQEKVVSKLHHAVTVSQASQADIETHFKRPAEQTPIIYNGIDTDIFHTPVDDCVEPFLLVTTASSDQPLKGLRYLILAVEELKAAFPKLRLQVVGELKEGGEIDRLIRQRGLVDTVIFTNRISTKKLVKIYHRAHVVICPSLYEGFGLPTAEAMSCGCAVIATDGGALPEVLGDAGVLIPKGNVHALVFSITSLLLDDELCQTLKKRARERVVETFCWTKVARDLTAFYQDILGDKPRVNR